MPSNANGRQPLPTSWADYERGGRRDSSGSNVSHVHFTEEEESATGREYGAIPRTGSMSQDLRRRRSSMSMRINTLRNAGGVNSIDNFARSWTRAGLFHEITPHARPSFRVTDTDDETDDSYSRQEVGESSPEEHRSLLRRALTEEGRRTSDNAIVEDDHPSKGSWTDNSEGSTMRGGPSGSVRDDSVFQVDPQLQSVFGGSYGTSYGSVTSRMPESSLRHGGRLSRPTLAAPTSIPVGSVSEDGDQEPLLVKQVEDDDGHIVNVVVGQSTLPQTIFNSVNVLIGVGLLALPLALQYSGWVIGLLFLIWAAVVTSYTAKVLAKCLDVDSSLITFADLALVSFGTRARFITSMLFCAELLGACVALVVLFADSLDALIPGLTVTDWKIICGIVIIPLSFLPLRLLSFSSVIGIISCTTIVLAVFVDGLIKPDAPGSLRQPMPTRLFPENWATIPISFGLLMSPWGGHSVFPNIYRDMRHPYKYRRAVDTTYVITSCLDIFMAVIGLLMFGDGVRDEVTSNILLTKGYPPWLSVLICICIAVIPLTKIPLNARPIISTIEVLAGLDPRSDPVSTPSSSGSKMYTRVALRAVIKVVTTIVFVLLAIVLPGFDTIMSLLGSVACFSICIILPCAFHLKLFGKEIPRAERALNWVLIVVSSILAVVSTVFNFLPLERLGLVKGY